MAGHAHKESKKIGIVDALIGGALFIGLTIGIQKGLAGFMPGFFTWETSQTVIHSGLLFVLVWTVLGDYFFRPFIDLVETREKRTTGDDKSAKKMLAEAKAIKSDIEKQLRETHLEGMKGRDKLIEKAQKQAAEISSSAAQAGNKRFSAARAEISGLKQKAESDIEAEAAKLSELVVERVLKTGGAPTVH